MTLLPGIRPALALLLLAAMATLTAAAAPRVVINEIHYHPANDDDRLQYIELHNAGDTEANLSGWKLRGAKFDLPPNTKLAPGAFLVIARDTSALQRIHGTAFSVVGNLGGKLKRSGEKLELVDASNQAVESFTFSDKSPWPLGPDGYASSLERICPTAPATEPRNWAPSKRAARNGREGTPGRANDNASAQSVPRVEEIKWQKLSAPNKPLAVSALIRSDADVAKATLEYYTYGSGARSGKTNQTEFRRISGHQRDGRYEAIIPPEPAGTLIRFVVKTTSNGAEHLSP
ncbi:MAG: lamin tail domain-containing protein, partial [Limisphaerales bacterium]